MQLPWDSLRKGDSGDEGFTAASLLNPWVALAAGITAATIALVKHTKKNAEFNKSVIAGETTNEKANDRLRELNKNIKELEERKEKGRQQPPFAISYSSAAHSESSRQRPGAGNGNSNSLQRLRHYI